MLKWFRKSTLPRGGTPPPPTAATTLSDGPVELPISPPSPPPIEKGSGGNPIQSLDQYAYLGYNNINGGNANLELVSIEITELGPGQPAWWRKHARRLSKKKSVWALIVLMVVLVSCLIVGLGLLWQKGNKGKLGHSSSSLKGTPQSPAPAKPDITPTNPVIDRFESSTFITTTTPTKRITTVTSTIRTALASPSAYTTTTIFPLWIGTFDSISQLTTSSGTCKTSTSTTILQACPDNARFTTTITDSKPDDHTIGTTPWVFQNHLVPTAVSGKMWYYSGNSIEKKYSHATSPGCEVVEKAEIWLGKNGTYMLEVSYESTDACTLDGGRAKNPTVQICECAYEGVFATTS